MKPLGDKNKITEALDRRTAEAILGVSRRTLDRYVDRYDLHVSDGKFNAGELKELKQDLAVCEDKELGSVVRQLFVLEREGITVHELMLCKYVDIKKLNKAIQTYNFYADYYRKPGLQRFGLSPEKYFMPGEVLARLKVSYPGVLTDLIQDGSLESKVIQTPGKTWNFIAVNHFMEFMDSKGVKGRILFTTPEVSRIIHASVNRIDKLAYRHQIGVKLREEKKSIYLFTIDDLEALKQLNENQSRNSRNY